MRTFNQKEVNQLLESQREDIALKLLLKYISEVDDDVLKNICNDVIDFK